MLAKVHSSKSLQGSNGVSSINRFIERVRRKVVATTAAAWWQQGSNLPALDGAGTIKRKTFFKQAPKRNWQQTAAFKSPLSHQRNWPGQLLMANYKCLCV